MEKFRYFILSFLLFPLLGSAQVWILQGAGFTTSSRGIMNIAPVSASIVWASAYDGTGSAGPVQDFTRTTNGGTTWTPGIVNNASGLSISMITAVDANTAWVAMYLATGSNPQGVYKTTNGGATWTRQTTASFSNANSFPDAIHFWDANNGWVLGDPINGDFEMYTTTNGGSTWVQVPGSQIPNALSGETGYTSNVCVNGDNVWFGTNAGRVFASTDRGHNWIVSAPYSTTQNTFPATKDGTSGLCLKYQTASDTNYLLKETSNGAGAFYALSYAGSPFTGEIKYIPGTSNTYITTGVDAINQPYRIGMSESFDGGVTWFVESTLYGTQFTCSGWFNNSTGWAGSFNTGTTDGIYKFNGVLTSPTADFVANNTTINVGQSVTFTNLSTGATSYQWEFPGGTPSSSTLQNPPPIVYNYAGSYDVSLTAFGQFASPTETKSNYINVGGGSASVTVISPNGGEDWQVGNIHNVTWSSSNITNVKIEYTPDNGSSWTLITASYSASAGSYSWTIPNNPSTLCKVRISDVGNSSISDMSDATFTISASSQSINVISPNGGENWLVGSIQNITWTSTGVTNVKIEYTTNNGSSWSTLISSYPASAGSYSWSVPNTPSTQCKVRISDTGNPSLYGLSANVFTISSASQSILVTNPNGGETWVVGSSESITWSSSGVTNVKIEYTSDNGSSWSTITSNYPANTGIYAWTVANSPSTQCKVRISDAGNASLSDMSDNDFTISSAGQSTPEICIVTVDSSTYKNMIVWEKPFSSTIDHYNVYVESNQADVYTLIGSVPYYYMSTFTDMGSNPLQQANRYKISIVDIYNVETALSDYHMTVHLTINQGTGNTWNLMWNDYLGFSYPSFNIYRGTSPTNTTLLATVASTINSFTDLYPPSGYVYYKIEVVKPIPCAPSKGMISSSCSNLSSNDPTLSINPHGSANQEVKIFPNPTTSMIKVVSDQIVENIEIYSSMGILVQSSTEVLKEMTFDLSTFSKGVYFIKMKIGSRTEIHKVVVL
jgi:hypothetical protein